jgi:hypothetical protein
MDIMENLPILILLGSAGVIITLYLCLTGKKIQKEEIKDTESDYITIFGISFSIISLIYFFRLLMMFFTGIISRFYLLAAIGLLVALLPLITIGLIRYKKKIRLKV